MYLLDENVLRELYENGNANVRRWIATVDDSDLRLSTATLFEKRRGAEALKRRDPERSIKLLAAIEILEKALAERIISIDAAVVAEWTRLLDEEPGQMGRGLGGNCPSSWARSRYSQPEGLHRTPSSSIPSEILQRKQEPDECRPAWFIKYTIAGLALARKSNRIRADLVILLQ